MFVPGQINDVEAASFYVGSDPTVTEYLLASKLSGTAVVRVINILEPAFTGAGPGRKFTFLGFKTDGTVAPSPAPRTRRIELVGDSISAGYGSRGCAFLSQNKECPVDDRTSGNMYSYNWAIAEHFQADIVPIAWSGKGMYVG